MDWRGGSSWQKALLLSGAVGALLIVGSISRSEAALSRPLQSESIPTQLVGEDSKVWLDARKGVERNTSELFARDPVVLAHDLRLHRLVRGQRARKQIAITFDDGPHPAYTPRLLEILKQYHAKATFFVVGEQAEQHPELIKAEIADGHCVANHTYHHVNLTRIPGEYVAMEIKACGKVLEQITGRAPHLFRPPGGDYNPQVAQLASALGYTMVLWTNDPGDYANPGSDLIKSRVLSKIHNGEVILLHDGIEQTIEVLPSILEYLVRKGYDVVTVDEMLRNDRQRPVEVARAVRPMAPVSKVAEDRQVMTAPASPKSAPEALLVPAGPSAPSVSPAPRSAEDAPLLPASPPAPAAASGGAATQPAP
jgi:peptidoglycan/xylan/chitin deacetylase (PgdA/CDA1 family)